MPLPDNRQVFTRVPVPSSHEPMQGVVTDIYNKIAALQGQTQNVPATIPTTQAITQIAQTVVQASSAAAAASGLGGKTDVIPVVLEAPNTTGLTDRNGNTVALIDGAVVSWNIGGSDFVLYQYSASATAWSYVGGMVARAQTNLTTLAGFLGAADTGLLVDVTDFAHILVWTGSAWTYADPSDPAGRIEMFLVDPSPTTGWQLCDGTANVPYLKKDGSTGTQTVPDLVSTGAKAAYAKMGSPASATPNAAVAPDSPLAYDGVTTGYILNNGAGSGSQTAQAKFTVAADSTAALTAIKNGTNGEPRNLVLRPWFRV